MARDADWTISAFFLKSIFVNTENVGMHNDTVEWPFFMLQKWPGRDQLHHLIRF